MSAHPRSDYPSAFALEMAHKFTAHTHISCGSNGCFCRYVKDVERLARIIDAAIKEWEAKPHADQT